MENQKSGKYRSNTGKSLALRTYYTGPTDPTDPARADLALPALASDAGASACRVGDARAALQMPIGQRLAQPPLSGEAAGGRIGSS